MQHKFISRIQGYYFNVQINKIKNHLMKLIEFLDSHNVSYASTLRHYHERVCMSDMHGMKKLLTEMEEDLYRGMGSFNDVWISKRNGHAVKDEDQTNTLLNGYRNKFYKLLAQFLKK